MRYVIIKLIFLICIVLLLGGCKKELKENLTFSSEVISGMPISGIVEIRNESIEPLITFSNLPNTWIDFDFDKNEWVYQGNLDEIVKEVQKYYRDMFQPNGMILIEIVRQLREKEFK